MTASPTPPDAQVGLPSEEDVARALAEALRREQIPDDIWRKQVAGFRDLEAMFPDYAQGYSLATDAFRQARAILDLIRPAFEAKEREIAELKGRLAVRMDYLVGLATTADRHVEAAAEARALSAEAKLAQAVEALEPFASYHEAAEFLDDKGHPLPDDQHAGYVYLTMGAFRRAAAAMGEKT